MVSAQLPDFLINLRLPFRELRSDHWVLATAFSYNLLR
jgi:hypothetical protein